MKKLVMYIYQVHISLYRLQNDFMFVATDNNIRFWLYITFNFREKEKRKKERNLTILCESGEILESLSFCCGVIDVYVINSR